MNMRPHVKLKNWMDGCTDGVGWGNVSRSRPPANDERSPLQLPQVDPHLCTVARLSHPNLIGSDCADDTADLCVVF